MINNFKKFAIIGSGSFGTAISCHIARICPSVQLYTRSKDTLSEINNLNKNSRDLGGIKLPSNIIATNNLAEIINNEVIFIVVPSAKFTDILDELKTYNIPKSTIFVIATKGLASDPVELLSDRFKKNFDNNFAFFSGPNFAKEIALGNFTSATIASNNIKLSYDLAKSLAAPNLEITTTSDIVTVQIAGIVKNIIAIKSGILEASGFGENARAWLISRALQEIYHISKIIGGNIETVFQPAVVGDLVLTSYSKTSRNSKFGFEFCKNNYSKEFIHSYPTLIEGVQASKLIKSLIANYNIKLKNLPIINSVIELF